MEIIKYFLDQLNLPITPHYLPEEMFFSYMRLIKQHKRFIAWYQRKLGISDYGLLWLIFIKGVIFGIVVEKIFF